MEHFSTSPTSLVPYRHLSVSPLYAQEWHIRPPAYDLYENHPIRQNPDKYDLQSPMPYTFKKGKFSPNKEYSQNIYEKPFYAEENFNDVKDPRDYPYGQYLSTTNLIPHEEMNTRVFCNGRSNAINYIIGAYTAHDIAHRENLQHIHKLTLANRYRHNCYDTFSPFQSF